MTTTRRTRTQLDTLINDWWAGLPAVKCPRCGGPTTLLHWHRQDRGKVEVRIIASCDDAHCNEAMIV